MKDLQDLRLFENEVDNKMVDFEVTEVRNDSTKKTTNWYFI